MNWFFPENGVQKGNFRVENIRIINVIILLKKIQSKRYTQKGREEKQYDSLSNVKRLIECFL